MSQDPSALDDLPKLTGSQLNALLTLFVAGKSVRFQSILCELDMLLLSMDSRHFDGF